MFADQKIDFQLAKDEINQIINAFSKLQSFPIETWDFEETCYLISSCYLNLTNFTVNVIFDENKLSFTEVSDGIYAFADDLITITISHDFISRTAYSTYLKGKGVIKVHNRNYSSFQQIILCLINLFF